MGESKGDEVRLFPAGGEAPPPENELELGCAYESPTVFGMIERAVHFIRRGAHDELWVKDDFDRTRWRAVRMEHHGLERRASCLEMFERLLRAPGGYPGPCRMRTPGLIAAEDLEALLARMAAEWKAAQQAAEEWRSAPIVRVAEELGLHPRPSGGKPTSWLANCPGTNHWLMVHAGTGEWGCGYCRKRGRVQHLRLFVEGRRRRKRE